MTVAAVEPRPAATDPTATDPPAPSRLPLLRRIALTGFMGCGKSTVGRLLAEALGWRFFDVDFEVEQKAGRKIADIFREDGEQRFRALESHALARSLGQTEAVLALGGGAPEILANRLLLEQTPKTAVVFLDGSFSTLFDRCVLQEGALTRPVLLDPADAARRFDLRLPIYRRIAHLCVDTEKVAPAAIADHILAQLGYR